jgi:hypothetical protein
MPVVANYLDFLVAFDDHIRPSSLGRVTYGHELKDIAKVAGRRDDAAGDVGRSLAATVQRLAELRNIAGSGHGRAEEPTVTVRDARLAGTAACGMALFVLDPQP